MKQPVLKMSGVLIAVLLIITGCSTPAHIERDRDTDFTKYKTFAWLATKNDKTNTDLVERQMKEAVSAELQKQGWRMVTNNPDVLLNYDLLVEKAVRENRDPVYSQPFTRLVYNPYRGRWMTIYYPSQFMGYENSQRTTKEGTITVTMIDSKTDKTVFQGWTTDEINSRNITSREIQNGVRAIFRKFDLAKN